MEDWNLNEPQCKIVVIKSLIFVNQDYQRKVSILVKELAKNELISISGM